MSKCGRPSEQQELIAARAALKEDEERTIAAIQAARGNRVTLGDCVWLAATILNTFDKWPNSPSAEDAASILRQTKWGMQVDSIGSLRPNHFAERFLRKFAPGWNWENHRDDGSHDRMNEKLVQYRASVDRFANALRCRHVTPTHPEPSLLGKLLRIKADDVTTWPTLRLLKLGTGMSERTIAKLISRLKPQPDEIQVAKCRPSYQKRGALPKRFAPRLVLGVITVFADDLENAPLDTSKKEALESWLIRLKRSLSQKVNLSVSGT